MHALMRVQSFHLEHYAGTVYAVVLCLSVCLCHKLVFCFEMVEQIELFFCSEASFNLSYTVF